MKLKKGGNLNEIKVFYIFFHKNDKIIHEIRNNAQR